MADALIPDHEADVQIFPVAPRLTHPDRPTPYVGPAIPDYRAAHRQTVGSDSDEWWAKVRISRSIPVIMPARTDHQLSASQSRS